MTAAGIRASWESRNLMQALLLVILAAPPGALTTATAAKADGAAWPICENRASRDEGLEPGGLKLLGVKESPLGDFPGTAAPLTHEHFFQQLREVWSDDCPRVMVELGLQPAPGLMRNWSVAALWLHYFNHSGLVLAVDAVDDYLDHFKETLEHGPLAGLFNGRGRMEVATVRAVVGTEQKTKKAKERPVSLDAPDGGKVLAADVVSSACSEEEVGPEGWDPRHPCRRILQRLADSSPLEYSARASTFDAIWSRELKKRHVDFLRVDLGSAGMLQTFKTGFVELLTARAVSILAFRVDPLWSKAELWAVVEWLDMFEYFSLFALVCAGSSQAGAFGYFGPGELETGPTTYLPLSGVDFDEVIDWDRLPLPQDILAFDLRQPDIFRTVQQGDVQCDADETSTGTCAQDGSGHCQGAGADEVPGQPQGLQVVRSETRALTIEWQAPQDGPVPETYELRVEPGNLEDTLDHDADDQGSGVQLHTIGGLDPSTQYTVTLRAMGPGGASGEARVVHKTEVEQASAIGANYNVVERLHCGMSSNEEVTPPGPPPQGKSFFRDVTDPSGCRARCDENPSCVAFQVKESEACWLYRRRPPESKLAGPGGDMGWWCGSKKRER